MDKELTPIQMAINERLFAIEQYQELRKTYDKNGQEALDILLTIMQNGVDTLTALLPTERTFAEGLFDAGYKYGDILKDYEEYAPDFSQFYKKYEDVD